MTIEEIPEANSRDVCLHILYQPRGASSGNNFTSFSSVNGLHNCSGFLFGKWPSDQHSTGLDINAYRQYVKPISKDKC